LTPQEAASRWAEISIYDKPPISPRLSGLALDYRILQISSRDSGQRSAQISFNVGQGSQDIGFRNDILVLFNALPARAIKLRVRDEKGQPAMASFVIRDRLNRLYPNPSKRLAPDFFFQPQIYRADGETVSLPPGYYNITYTGGPEYRAHTKEFAVDDKGPPPNFLSNWNAGSIRRSMAGIPAITTCMPWVVRITRTPPRASCPRI
jgi:hypothetical protein